MTRTLDNCSLIRTCTEELNLEKPSQSEGKCSGYIRRGRLHHICTKCDLCSRREGGSNSGRHTSCR